MIVNTLIQFGILTWNSIGSVDKAEFIIWQKRIVTKAGRIGFCGRGGRAQAIHSTSHYHLTIWTSTKLALVWIINHDFNFIHNPTSQYSCWAKYVLFHIIRYWTPKIWICTMHLYIGGIFQLFLQGCKVWQWIPILNNRKTYFNQTQTVYNCWQEKYRDGKYVTFHIKGLKVGRKSCGKLTRV